MTATRSSLDIYQYISDAPKLNIEIDKNINYSNTEKINNLIDQLRKQDFDYVYKNQEGKTTLVKYHDEKANQNEDLLNPVSLNEEEIQGLFFLRGMLLIAEQDKRLETGEIITIFNNNKKSTLLLADEFINILREKLNLSHEEANTQLTMAKDLSILLADHPAICTISEEADKITIEKSTPYKISKNYYDYIFVNLGGQPWFQNAKKLAGFKENQKNTWLDNFFENNKIKIQELGVTAPPSARWLPIPANNQLVEIDVVNKIDKSIAHTEFLRTGIAAAYDIRKIDDKDQVQKELAAAILKELMTSQLKEKIKKFKELYEPIITDNKPNFYINYQTLLSPLIGELHFTHIDNNSKFINIAKEAIDQVKKELSSQELGVNLIIEHTNAAVNRNAYLSNEFSQDDKARRNKITEFNQIYYAMGKEKLDQIMHTNKPLFEEIAQRKIACDKLQNLLDNQPPYNKHYQRNIMMAALEHLSMGMQCINLAGCKSARDRTAIFAAAIKVMLENPAAMENWAILEKGIAKSLKQGHAFRSMIFHNAVLKVSMVHERFMKMLNTGIQENIKSLLIYARKLPKYNAANYPIDTQQLIDMKALNNKISINENATMTISKEEAEELLAKCNQEIDRSIWDSMYKNFSGKLKQTGNQQELDKYLTDMRNMHLNSKSYIFTTEEKLNIRIYPKNKNNKNINTSIDDIFASGIDSMRGALLILENIKIEELKNNFTIFYNNITNLREKNKNVTDEKIILKNLQAAHKEYQKLNGTLAKLLVNANCYNDEILASKGILEARDLLWIQSRRNEAVCTVRDGALSFAKRCEFPVTDPNYKNQIWFKEFSSKHTWAEKFFKNNSDVLSLSPTPMQRSIPNPANAWEEATILININKTGKKEVGQIISGVRLGITSPYQIKDKKERQRMTNENHARMITDNKLVAYANKHIDTWGDQLLSIDDKNQELVIPIFHQTLVDPGALRYIADRSGNDPKDMIKRKNIANKLLQDYLDKKEDLFYDPKTKKIVRTNPSNNNIKIKFIIKETNNGINTSEKVTTKTDKDVSDARSLIDMTIEKLQRYDKHTKSDDIKTIINYLNESQPNNPRKMDNTEKEALKKVGNKLENKNLLLLTQSAVNLASFMSNDLTTNFIGSIQDGMAIVDTRFKPVDLNDATYKSCYERIMAELLGVRMGGCKSALDREQEVAELTNAMYRQFNETNEIINYYDNQEIKNKFINKYVNTQHKHNMCEIITGTLGTSDMETQGQAYHHESHFEQKVSALFNKNRHPGYYDDNYLKKPSSTKQMFQVFSPENRAQLSALELLPELNIPPQNNRPLSINKIKQFIEKNRSYTVVESIIVARREVNPQNNGTTEVIFYYTGRKKFGIKKLRQDINIKILVDDKENKSWLTDISKLKKMNPDEQRLAAIHWIQESSKYNMPKNQTVQLSAYEKLPDPFLRAINFYLKESNCNFELIPKNDELKSTLAPSPKEEEILRKFYNSLESLKTDTKPEKEKNETPTISLKNS